MKITVVTDAHGNVLGSGRTGQEKLPDGTEIELGLDPLSGQILQDIDVPDDTMQLEPSQIHRRIRQIV